MRFCFDPADALVAPKPGHLPLGVLPILFFFFFFHFLAAGFVLQKLRNRAIFQSERFQFIPRQAGIFEFSDFGDHAFSDPCVGAPLNEPLQFFFAFFDYTTTDFLLKATEL